MFLSGICSAQAMKRTKPTSQPTRIMPIRGNRGRDAVGNTDAVDGVQSNPTFERLRRRKTIKRVATESSVGSESSSEFEETACTSTRNDRRKRERVDMEHSTRSVTSPLNQSSALIDSRGVRESPELGCSICLGAVENRAFTDACYHSFCFECLVEWSRVRAVCPLCKKSFHSIIHSFRSYDDYKLYQVPTSYVSNSVNISSLSSSESSNFLRVGRLQNSNNPPARSVSSDEQMLAFRRRVYTHAEDMQLCGLWSSDRVVMSPPNQVSPAMFDCYPVMLERVRPWVLRDVAVIIGNGDVQYVAGTVLDLLRHFPLTSEDFYERLFPYLGLHTRRFLLELESFARSPFDMTTYDARVVYSAGTSPDTSLHLPADRVEDVSSSDDSDIEIVTPAVVTVSEPTVNSHISEMTDHVLPDFLHCLRSLQRNLMMTFNSMNRPTFYSGLESPVPGPSGLGQAVVSEESSVGSQASRSAHDADERSYSPMVLSDADSDIVVVDIDRPARSPIHISSGEDDRRDEHERTRRPVKRRRHRSRHHKKRRRRFEQGDNLTNNIDSATENEVPVGDVALPEVEPHATDYNLVDPCVESTAEELMHAEEPSENSNRTQNLSSSHSAGVKSNDHSSASAKLSSSKPHLWLDDDTISDTGRRALQPTYPARSRSANSVDSASVTLLHGTNDVKPLTCKKHVSGHKSSKQKARELATDKRFATVVGANSEKSIPADEEGATDGSRDLLDSGNNDQSSADLSNPVTVTSVVESAIATGDFTSSGSNEVSGNCRMVPDSHLDDKVPLKNDEVTLPCTGETCLIPVVSAADCHLENIGQSSFSTSEVTAAELCLPMANENSCDAKAISSSSDAVQTHSPDEVDLLSNNAADVELNCAGKNSFKCKNPTASSDCIQPHDDDDEVCCPLPISSSCVTTNLSSPPADSCALLECVSFSPEPSSDVKVSTASLFSLNSPIVESCESEDQNMDLSDRQPAQSGVSDRLAVSPQLNEATLFACNSPHRNSQFDCDTNCLRITDPQNTSLCDEHCGLISPGHLSTDRSLPYRPRSSISTSRGGLVIDEYPASPTTPDLVINNSIVICSPVGVVSSDSDSDVEWLETATAGHHRCISISSGGSSVVFSPSDDDLESVLSDTDSLEIFDDEPPASPMVGDYSAEPTSSSQTSVERSPPLLPSVSDESLSTDVDEVENILNPEQVKSDNKIESSDSDRSR